QLAATVQSPSAMVSQESAIDGTCRAKLKAVMRADKEGGDFIREGFGFELVLPGVDLGDRRFETYRRAALEEFQVVKVASSAHSLFPPAIRY
ncbi:MAG: hypothetical protein ACJAVK_000837, partial [Akkermansiaceae bacterium]